MSEKMTSQNELTEIKLVPYNKPQTMGDAQSCYAYCTFDLNLLSGP
jgi:hypothetical protein